VTGRRSRMLPRVPQRREGDSQEAPLGAAPVRGSCRSACTVRSLPDRYVGHAAAEERGHAMGARPCPQ
jgi:hypothetical protein